MLQLWDDGAFREGLWKEREREREKGKAETEAKDTPEVRARR